jgi:hypothetical protein
VSQILQTLTFGNFGQIFFLLVLFMNLYFISAPLVASQRPVQSAKDSESLLLNVAGKLLVFQRDRTGPQIKQKEKSPQKAKPVSGFYGNRV